MGLFFITTTVMLMPITPDAIGNNFCVDLKEFYSTKLFAIETHLSILIYTKDMSPETEKEIAALIAYNAGPQVVRRGEMIPPESRHYLKNVLSYYRKISGNESL